jgi:hypothetical protein
VNRKRSSSRNSTLPLVWPGTGSASRLHAARPARCRGSRRSRRARRGGRARG